jgi:hypothetical protein
VRCSWPLGGDLWHALARPLSLPRVLWDGVSPGVAHTFRWTDPVPSLFELLQWVRSTPNALREARDCDELDGDRARALAALVRRAWVARRTGRGSGAARCARPRDHRPRHLERARSRRRTMRARAGCRSWSCRGSEVATDEGDVLALFVEEDPVEKHALALCDRVHAQGGLIVLPHPCRFGSPSPDSGRAAPT